VIFALSGQVRLSNARLAGTNIRFVTGEEAEEYRCNRKKADYHRMRGGI